MNQNPQMQDGRASHKPNQDILMFMRTKLFPFIFHPPQEFAENLAGILNFHGTWQGNMVFGTDFSKGKDISTCL